jgi:hypothetical protein
MLISPLLLRPLHCHWCQNMPYSVYINIVCSCCMSLSFLCVFHRELNELLVASVSCEFGVCTCVHLIIRFSKTTCWHTFIFGKHVPHTYRCVCTKTCNLIYPFSGDTWRKHAFLAKKWYSKMGYVVFHAHNFLDSQYHCDVWHALDAPQECLSIAPTHMNVATLVVEILNFP